MCTSLTSLIHKTHTHTNTVSSSFYLHVQPCVLEHARGGHVHRHVRALAPNAAAALFLRPAALRVQADVRVPLRRHAQLGELHVLRLRPDDPYDAARASPQLVWITCWWCCFALLLLSLWSLCPFAIGLVMAFASNTSPRSHRLAPSPHPSHGTFRNPRPLHRAWSSIW